MNLRLYHAIWHAGTDQKVEERDTDKSFVYANPDKFEAAIAKLDDEVFFFGHFVNPSCLLIRLPRLQ